MKKTIRFMFCLILCLTFVFPLITGCKVKEKDDKKDNTTPAKKIELITGFESYDELAYMRKLNYFGSIKQYTKSDNAYKNYFDYITEGDTALLVEAQGNYVNGGRPTLCLDTTISTIKTDPMVFGSFEKFDYSDVGKLMLDVYNDNDFDITVYFQYQTKTTTVNKVTSPVKVVVPKKESKTCEFVIERNFISQLLSINLVTQLRLSFDCEIEYMQPRRRMVIDNFRYETTTDPIDQSVKVRKEGEVESFDRGEFLSIWSNFANEVWFPSKLSFNDDQRYVKSGAGSFKMENSPFVRPESTCAMGWAFKPQVTDISGYDHLSMWFLNTGSQSVWLRWYIKTSVNKGCDLHEPKDGKCPASWPADGIIYADQHFNGASASFYLPAMSGNIDDNWVNIKIPVTELDHWGIDIKNFDYFAISFHGVDNTKSVAIYMDEFWAEHETNEAE